jgi:hypothetical protein
MRFPKVTGSNLERKSFTLPGDLEGEHNLVILAFRRHQQMLVDTWMFLARHLEQRHPGFVAYELPVIESRSKLSQWLIDAGMRAGIADESLRERTITLYVNKTAFLQSLDVDDESTIYALLVDRKGNVLWHTSGPLDLEKAESLSHSLGSCPRPTA